MKTNNKVWFKDLPSHWEVSKIASTYKLRNQKVSDRDFEPLSVTMKGIFPQWENVAKSDAHDDRKLVRKGDFVINSRSDRRGSCGISDRDGSVSLINLVLQPLTNMYPGYYNWLFHTEAFADEFYKWGHGIVNDLWSTSWQEMKKILIPQPPIEEQMKISTILDKKCGEIDGLTSDIEKEIEILTQYKKSIITETVTKGLNKNIKLKNSGIEWAKQIPEHWEVIPNKYLMKKVKNICPKCTDEKILSLTMNGVIVRDLDAGGKMPTSFDGYQIVKPGNLLMCLFDIDVTPRCVGLIKDYGLTSPAYSQFVMKEKAYAPYYYYYYLMLDYTKELLHLAKNLRHSFTEDQLGTINTPVPPIQEQKEIAEYLDKKCKEIDSILEDKNKQLEALESYKKSIIYEYVTGKKEVI